MIALTDFADQAVVLPLIGVILLAFLLFGWRRGALIWLTTTGMALGTTVLLKLVFDTCGTLPWIPTLQSPSGHTASAAIIAGVLVATLGGGRSQIIALAIFAGLGIGLTRFVLGEHTLAEALVGGAIGVAGASAFAFMAGPAPTNMRWLILPLVVLALFLHGRHFDVEEDIRAVAFALPHWCQGTFPRHEAQARPIFSKLSLMTRVWPHNLIK
jgi:PAP2 superfamily